MKSQFQSITHMAPNKKMNGAPRRRGILFKENAMAKKMMSFYIDEETRAKLEREAERRDRSMSDTIRILIKERIANIKED